MSLKVWLPLNGDLSNQGLSNISFINGGATISNNGKIGQCYHFAKANSQYIKSVFSLDMTSSSWSICCWVKFDTITADGYLWCFTFTHTHDGSTHTHTIEHSHDHNHYLSEENHGHHHLSSELETEMRNGTCSEVGQEEKL